MIKMNEEEFNRLSKEEQRHLSSEYRKTVHDGEIVFLEEKDAKSLTKQEAREQLLKKRNELLMSLGFAVPNDTNNEKIANKNTRHGR